MAQHFTGYTNAWRIGTSRTVVDDATGRVWRVSEVDARRLPGARGPSCLLFDSPTMVRRVWRFPGDWGTLPDEALVALSEVT